MHPSPSPSPDGRLIAYVSMSDCDHGYGASIKAVTTSGRSVRPLFVTNRDAPGSCFAPGEYGSIPDCLDPAWAPDADRLAYWAGYLGDGDPNQGIYVASSRNP
jgi:hypothetical protein